MHPAQPNIDAAASRATKADPLAITRALIELANFFHAAEHPATIEQAREHCTPLPDGVDARTWGHITLSALKLGLIVKTSHFAIARSSHHSPKRLYRAAR